MRRKAVEQDARKRLPPATSPAEREQQMIAYAMDLVEQRLLDGTATSQETVHFLKLATEKERLERMKIEQDIELSKAKITAMESSANIEELLNKAIDVFATYRGDSDYYEDV